GGSTCTAGSWICETCRLPSVGSIADLTQAVAGLFAAAAPRPVAVAYDVRRRALVTPLEGPRPHAKFPSRGHDIPPSNARRAARGDPRVSCSCTAPYLSNRMPFWLPIRTRRRTPARWMPHTPRRRNVKGFWRRSAMRANRCWFCGSKDTDKPYDRPSEIAFLSRIFPRLGRRFCRACGRHFWAIRSEHRARTRNKVHGIGDVGRSPDVAAWRRAAAPVGEPISAGRDRDA